MESDVLRQDDTNAGSGSTEHKHLDGKKLDKKGSSKDSPVNFTPEETTMTEAAGKATAGFSYVQVKGKSNTDDLFAERMKAHKTEIDAFLAAHPEVRLER